MTPRGIVQLGLDTATTTLAVALWSPDGGVLARARPDVGRAHAARWVEVLEAVLAEAGLDRGDLTGIGVGVGPGSYTGTRVGVAAAKGLARGLGVPLAGGDTLAAVAYGALADGETGLVRLDARRGRVYAGVYRRDGDRIAVVEPAHKAAAEEVRARWPAARLLDGGVPDAAHHARVVSAGAAAEAVYL